MSNILRWFGANIPWIFSGIGVFIIGLFIINKAKKKKHTQIIKGNSSGIQAGGDIDIKIK